MSKDSVAVIASVFLCFLIVGIFSFLGYLAGADNPSAYGKRQAICEYLGGVSHDELCIRDGRVIETKR